MFHLNERSGNKSLSEVKVFDFRAVLVQCSTYLQGYYLESSIFPKNRQVREEVWTGNRLQWRYVHQICDVILVKQRLGWWEIGKGITQRIKLSV